jgi:hypothetical protein
MKNSKNHIELLFLATIKINAQNSKFIFEHINYDESFSQSMISSIKQSKKGFIWIGADMVY